MATPTQLVTDSLLRERDLLKPVEPGARPILSMSRASFWRMIADGQFPRTIKLRGRVCVWKASTVNDWLAAQGQ